MGTQTKRLRWMKQSENGEMHICTTSTHLQRNHSKQANNKAQNPTICWQQPRPYLNTIPQHLHHSTDWRKYDAGNHIHFIYVTLFIPSRPGWIVCQVLERSPEAVRQVHIALPEQNISCKVIRIIFVKKLQQTKWLHGHIFFIEVSR